MATTHKEKTMITQTKTSQLTISEVETSPWKGLFKLGGIAALAVVAIVFLQGPIFILYPQPTTVLGHFIQFQQNKLLGLVDLDLILILAEIVTIPILVALYAALKRFSPTTLGIALASGLGGIGLFFAVNPTLAMLFLSDQYAAAATEAQRAAFLAAGEALTAQYNGTAFGLFFILCGVSYILFAVAMLKSGIFSKATGYMGLLMGAMMLVPPLPVLGTVALTLSYVVILPSLVWNILIAIRLFQLARATPK
jgi:hypothetical protein